MASSQEQYGQIANYNALPKARGDGQSSALEVDVNGNLLVSVAGGASSVQYTDGATGPAHPIGNATEFLDSNSVWQTVSAAQPLPIGGASLEKTFSSGADGNFVTTDTSLYRSVSVQLTSLGTNAQVSFMGSNDNSTFYQVQLIRQNNPPTASASQTGIFYGSIAFRYFRLTITGTSGGTNSGTVEFYTTNFSPPAVNVSQFGGWSITSNALDSSVAIGQYKVTASAVQLPSNVLVNGVIFTALSTNTGNIFIGSSGVTTTADGTGNGYILEPGSSTSAAISNTNLYYVIGTANDVLSYIGS